MVTSGRSTVESHPFDRVAASYDDDFTHSQLGRWLRAAVWAEIGPMFRSGDRVLELGCGTGEDAMWLAQRGVHVTATDSSQAMLDVARRKVADCGITERVQFMHLDVRDITNFQSVVSTYQFDGVFSNFGALNCLADRRPLAEALSPCVRPGGYVALVVMGPLCLWEIGWYLLHGHVRAAFRRFRSGVEAHVGAGEYVRVWYPSPRRLRAEFGSYFCHRNTVGLGTVLPPSYLGHLMGRWPRLFETLAPLDRRLGRVFPGTWLNDHYLVVFEQTDDRGRTVGDVS